ncbi:type II secretion system minor pseudopilin GspK [Cognatiluteimonas weifangensis]|uniref:Type II secretion system protein K n=1 Tax=Cognatiluteimonas weifangensis TaxID=2303539 RepID=A0A372DKS2_9GAMM|nr:type II secretion system minor pseudopilin GspK [Luteimonas weifangensis]RFP60099.1 general secretion pathway protein GspK [Luteimonas weifangensis]
MRRQRGVALVVALLVVALAMLLVAALLDAGELTRARLRNGWRAEQSRQLLGGLEAWAAAGLLADLRASGPVDGFGEAWARPMPPLELPGARIEGRLRDLGGCFNVNALAPGGSTDPRALRRFARLLRALQLPRALASQAADYIDADASVQDGGAEDDAYAGARTANAALLDAGELRRLPAMTGDAWQALAPLLCALPTDQRLNLNTAPAVLWLTLDDAITPAMAQRLARGDGAMYPDLAAVRRALQREGAPVPDLSACAVGSRYFQAEATIVADGIAFGYRSQLQRLPDRVRVIARTRGGLRREPRP